MGEEVEAAHCSALRDLRLPYDEHPPRALLRANLSWVANPWRWKVGRDGREETGVRREGV